MSPRPFSIIVGLFLYLTGGAQEVELKLLSRSVRQDSIIETRELRIVNTTDTAMVLDVSLEFSNLLLSATTPMKFLDGSKRYQFSLLAVESDLASLKTAHYPLVLFPRSALIVKMRCPMPAGKEKENRLVFSYAFLSPSKAAVLFEAYQQDKDWVREVAFREVRVKFKD